jgi:hypothetical protein
MAIKSLLSHSVLMMLLTISATSAATQTKPIKTLNLSSNAFSIASTFASYSGNYDYVNAASAISILNANNAFYMIGYSNIQSSEAGYFNRFSKYNGAQITHSPELRYGQNNDPFQSAIYKISNGGNNNLSESFISRSAEASPEPKAYSMMFAGLVLIIFVVRRRRH